MNSFYFPLIVILMICCSICQIQADCSPADCNERGICNVTSSKCICDAPWKGDGCMERDVCQVVSHTGKFVERNCGHGHCEPTNVQTGESHCVCDDGYHEEDCSVADPCIYDPNGNLWSTRNPCSNEAECVPDLHANPPKFSCNCKRGFSPPTCKYKDPCEPINGQDPCGNDGICKIIYDEDDYNASPDKHCQCNLGYSGSTCLVRDPCYFESKCEHGSKCVRQNNTDYKCDCGEPFLMGKYCNQFNFCNVQDAPGAEEFCTQQINSTFWEHCHACLNKAKWCQRLTDFSYNCGCLEDFYGVRCQFARSKARIIPEIMVTENGTVLGNQSVTMFDCYAGQYYDLYFVILKNATYSWYDIKDEYGIETTISHASFLPIKDVSSEKIQLAAEKLKIPGEQAYFYKYRHKYDFGNHELQFRLRKEAVETVHNWTGPYNISKLYVNATLPPGINCIPTTKLSNVAHSPVKSKLIEYSRIDHFNIDASLNFTCLGDEFLFQQITTNPDTPYHFEWKLYKLTSLFPLPSIENDQYVENLANITGSNMEFMPHTLLEGLYKVECHAYVKINGTDFGQTGLGYFKITYAPPLIILEEGDEQTVNGNEEIILDAHRSLDISFPEETDYLEFIWTCVENCNGQGPWHDAEVEIPAGTFASESTVIIYLRLKSAHAKNEASKIITLHVRGNITSHVECIENCQNYNPADVVVFQCNYTIDNEQGPLDTIEWTWLPPGEVFPAMVQDKPHLTSITLPQVHDVGERTIICTATTTLGLYPIVSKFHLQINRPPDIGECTVNPKSGEFLKTTFDIVCTEFEDNDQPVDYSFYVEIPNEITGKDLTKNLENRVLLGHDGNPEISDVYLPYGGANWYLNVVVIATDSKGLSSDVKVPVQVFRPPDHEIPNIFQEMIFRNNSELRKRVHSNDIQAALQLQVAALYGINDETIKSTLPEDVIRLLLNVVAFNLDQAQAHTFKEMEQIQYSLHILDQVEDRAELNVFTNVSKVLFRTTSQLQTFVYDEHEITPKTDVDTLIEASVDSANRIIKASEIFSEKPLVRQPNYLPTVNFRDELNFDKLDTVNRDYFTGVRGHENTFDIDENDDVSISAPDAVKGYAKIGHHCLYSTQQASDTAAALPNLGYDHGFHASTKHIGAVGLTLPKNSTGINVTMSTLTSNSEIHMNLPEEFLNVIQNSSDIPIEVHVIESIVNPFPDDSSAVPNTPVISTVLKQYEEHIPIAIQDASVPMEFTLPFIHQLTVAEIRAGKTPNVKVDILPPDEITEFYGFPVIKLNLPYNSKISIHVMDRSSISLTFKILAIKDRPPILNDFCTMKSLETNVSTQGITTEFKSEELDLNETSSEPFLEYYIGFFPDDSNPSNLLTQQNFSVAFTRVGCLFRDEDQKFWSEVGCMVKDTVVNTKKSSIAVEKITCLCTHASIFSGAHFVLPHTIENTSLFADFSLEEIEKNPVVIITVSVLLILYAIGLLICKYLDKRHEKKSVGLTIMADLKESSLEKYYLITVMTGANLWAGTSSCVCLTIYGSKGRSQIYTLKDPNITVFRRGSIDTFLVPCDIELGDLEKIRLWTDYGGHDPAWCCRKIMIRHILSDTFWHFYVNRWLTVSSDQSTVILEIPATTKEQQRNFFVRYKENLYEQFDDIMLWRSLFRSSPSSTFTRCQRLSCAFALLSSQLLLDIMTLGTETEDESGLFDFGDYQINLYSIVTALVIFLISFPFSFIVVNLFRNITPRYIPTLIVWKNVIPATAKLGENNIFIPNVHGEKSSTTNKPSDKKQKRPSFDIFEDNDIENDEDDDDSNDDYSDKAPVQFQQTTTIVSNNDNRLSPSSSSSFSIPSTDIPRLEGWIELRIHNNQQKQQNHDSGMQTEDSTEDDFDDMYDDEFVNCLDVGENIRENWEANNLKRLGRRAMTHAVRDYDPDSFIFKGEHDIPHLEELIDKRILEGRNKPKESSSEDVPDSENGEQILKQLTVVSQKPKLAKKKKRKSFKNLFKKVGKKAIAPWKKVVTDEYLEEIDEELEKEIENREFIQNKNNWTNQIVLELCYLPRQKRPRFLSLPWWCLYIAWIVCIISILVCVGLTILFGAHYGYLRSMRWLENLVVTFILTELAKQPVIALIITVICTYLGRTHKLEERLQVIIEDSTNASFLKSRKPYNFSIFKSYKTYGPLAGNIIFRLSVEARRMRELRGKLFRLILCICLLIPLIAFSYSGHYSYNYGVTKNIRNMFKLNELGEGKLRFENEQMVYDYIENVVIANIHPVRNYNGTQLSQHEQAFLSDQQTALMGVWRIRQQRVKSNECPEGESHSQHHEHPTCVMNKAYKKSTQDRDTYNPQWVEVMEGSQRYTPSLTNDGWEFHGENSTKDRSLSFSGYQGRYDGGGYILELGRKRSESRNILKYMKRMKWLDHRTRAIFIEFTLLNPNINKFVDVVLLIEQGPTWAFSLLSRITPIELLPITELSAKSDEAPWLSASLVLIVIVLIIDIWLLFDEICHSKTYKKLYKSVTFWTDLILIMLVIASLCVATMRFLASQEFTEKIDVSLQDDYISIQRAAYWDITQRSIFSVTQAVVFVKTWRMIMFTNKSFIGFALTIKLTFGYMLAFVVMLIIFVCAFAYSGFFLFGQELWEFSSWGEGIVTLIDQLLGVSIFDEFIYAQSWLGKIYAFAFGFVVIFIVLNFVVALLDVGVHEAKEVVHQRKIWLTFTQYFLRMLYMTFPNLSADYRKRKMVMITGENFNTIPPERLYAMKKLTVDYYRKFLESSGHYKMKEMQEHCNKLLAGTGYRIISKKWKSQEKEKVKLQHVEQLREMTAVYLKEKLGHDMKPEEFKEYANFNKAIVKLRIKKMEAKLVQLEKKVDQFVDKLSKVKRMGKPPSSAITYYP